MRQLSPAIVLIARLLMVILFVVAGYGKMGAAYTGTQEYMQSMGVPGWLLPLTILLELGGGIAVLVGLFTRPVALAIALFSLLTAFVFHANLAESMQQIQFMKNIAIAGGFLLLSVMGAGTWSLDHLLFKKGNSFP